MHIDIQETVIVVFNENNDIIAVIRPTDPLNPQFEMFEIGDLGDFDAAIIPVMNMTQFLEEIHDNRP